MSSATKFLFAMFLLCMTSAYAEARIKGKPADFKCDPAGFTLIREDDNKMRLQGTLETPSPGFSYKIDGSDKIGHMQMSLVTPDGAQLAVIDSITVNEVLEQVDSYSDIRINIQKDFNWGPDKIVCTAVPYDPANHPQSK